MDIETLCKFDIRLSYFTEKDHDIWNNLNRFARTLWFEKAICGPDIEYSRFAVDTFRLYPQYISWTYSPRKNGGYLLTDNTIIINADLMNGWWNLFKRIANISPENSRSQIVPQLFESFENITETTLSSQLVKSYGHSSDVWDTFLNYLDVVYTIGNITPAGANPGGSGLDLWFANLATIKNWFNNPQISTSKKSIISKWLPLLESYYSPNNDQSWSKFIKDHFFDVYIDFELTSMSSFPKNDDDLVSLFNTLTKLISERSQAICTTILENNKCINYSSIPNHTIVT